MVGPNLPLGPVSVKLTITSHVVLYVIFINILWGKRIMAPRLCDQPSRDFIRLCLLMSICN